MAADSNMGFPQDAFLASALNRHAISFQSGATNSTSTMVSVGNLVNTTGITFNGNSGMINNLSGIASVGNSTSGFLLDSVPDQKHDIEVAVEWSTDEQTRLEQGLVRFADEPTIMRYIKIAATLGDKTVRDVALRCRWMTNERIGKRRKPEHHTGRKMKDRKEMTMESSKASITLPPTASLSVFSPVVQHTNYNDRMSCEALGSTTRRLLDENTEVFNQIMTNLSMYKIQENIDLFCHTRNNITTILNNMREMPGIMSQMPPLPVSINQEVANSILPNTVQNQTIMFNSASRMHMKQEPRC